MGAGKFNARGKVRLILHMSQMAGNAQLLILLDPGIAESCP